MKNFGSNDNSKNYKIANEISPPSRKISTFVVGKDHKTFKYQKLQPVKHISTFSTMWLNNSFPPKPKTSR